MEAGSPVQGSLPLFIAAGGGLEPISTMRWNSAETVAKAASRDFSDPPLPKVELLRQSLTTFATRTHPPYRCFPFAKAPARSGS
jgi:hypothetical protein